VRDPLFQAGEGLKPGGHFTTRVFNITKLFEYYTNSLLHIVCNIIAVIKCDPAHSVTRLISDFRSMSTRFIFDLLCNKPFRNTPLTRG
jgi:hypothetical protein